MAKAEEKQEQQEQPEVAVDDAAYIAEVVNVYNKCGVGGDITLCRVLLRHNNRAIVRAIMGPVKPGDLVSLRECVRESRSTR